MKMVACFLVGLCFIFAASAVVGLNAQAEKALKTEQVKPGDLKGFLKDSKGKPFPKVELTVVNEKGEVIQKAVTNENGEYLFKNLPEGGYTLKVAGKEAFRLEVTPKAAVGTVKARLPSAVRHPVTGMLVPEALTALEWTLIVVGGVGLAVAVPTIIQHNDSDDDPVSP
jgi:hypothetical protein